MNSAGRILIMPKGEWKADAEYEMLDVVKYNGTSWLAKKAVKGIEPSADNSEWWYNMFDINIANNLTTTDGEKALDARQGKVLNDKIDKLNNINKLFSTDDDFPAWTVLPLNETYRDFKYVYMELKNANDCLIDSAFIPAYVFETYSAETINIFLTGGNDWATVMTQSPSTITIAKLGGKLEIWGIEKIS